MTATASKPAAKPTKQVSDRVPHAQSEHVYVNISTDVYIDPELNHREVAESTESIESLEAQIETTGGLLQSIVIVKTPDEHLTEHSFAYELLAGFRRCQALKNLAEKTGDSTWTDEVPADVRASATTQERYVVQLIENLGRKDLTEIEIALAFRKAVDDPAADLNQAQLSKMIGWPTSTVSNYLKVARSLPSTIIDLVLEGKIIWSNAKTLASSGLEGDELKSMAALAETEDVETFTARIAERTGKADATKDEAPAATPAAQAAQQNGEAESPQRAQNAKRSSTIIDKYLPKFEEELKSAKTDTERLVWSTRRDTAKFIIGEADSELAAVLAPWEEELTEQAAEHKLQAEQEREKHKFIRQTIKAMNTRLAEVPDIHAKDRRLPTLPEVMLQARGEIEESIKKAQEAKLWVEGESPVLMEGFPVESIDAFMEEINTAYAQDEKKKVENAKKRAEAKAKKEQDDAAAKLKADQEGLKSEVADKELAAASA